MNQNTKPVADFIAGLPVSDSQKNTLRQTLKSQGPATAMASAKQVLTTWADKEMAKYTTEISALNEINQATEVELDKAVEEFRREMMTLSLEADKIYRGAMKELETVSA